MINELKSSTGGCSFYILTSRKHRSVLERHNVPQTGAIHRDVLSHLTHMESTSVTTGICNSEKGRLITKKIVQELMFASLDVTYL